MSRYDFQGKTVLITGASMGIGEVFARELSRRGATLVLSARSEGKLRALATELGDAHVIVEDLTRAGAARRVYDAVSGQGLSIDVLINNAGFAAYGPFSESSFETQSEEVALNVKALVELTHLFLPEIQRRRGGVINVASTAAYQPVPFMAVYGATKAFVLSFSEALWAELRDRGVRVVALCPGATDTPFFARAGEQASLGKKARPEDVVRLGLDAFDANRPSVIHGFGNWLTSLTSRFTSRALTAKITGKLMEPKPRALPAGR